MKKTILTLGVLSAIVGGLFIAPKAALAYRGDPNIQGPNYSAERHEAMTQAFDNNNYNAWKNLMADRPIVSRITASNFYRFVQMHTLQLQGKTDEANKIRAELGLGQKNGSGLRQGNGRYVNK